MILEPDQIETEEVLSWEGLHLLHFHSSSCSQKVRILLREKVLKWTSHPINLAREKHISSWFLGINPRGVVPVLVHDGVVHVESNDILEYLDALPSSTPSYFPKDPAQRDDVLANLDFEDSLHMDLRVITMGYVMPAGIVAKSKATLARWERDGRDDPKRALEVKWWRDFAKHGISVEVARASAEAHRSAFSNLETRLGESATQGNKWISGANIGALDLAWFITTTRLLAAGYPLDHHPRLAAWHDRLSQRPTFREETEGPTPLRLALVAYHAYRRFTGTRLSDVMTS